MAFSNKQEQLALQELDIKLTQELRDHQESVLKKFSKEKGWDCTLPSLHGTIGGKNRQYADVVNNSFSDPKEFISAWTQGFMEYHVNSYNPMINLLKDEEFRNYTFTFLERNFYRNLLARTRKKPDQSLWSIWFGSGNLTWGLVIAPVHRGGEWTNDVSEIRRANYKYWTVGHIMATGLIVPEDKKPYKFKTVDDLLAFYGNVIKRSSNSKYEQDFCDQYIEYIKNSENPLDEPFLIPEFRYAGLDKKHKYRLDFTILNSHTFDLVGVEVSPTSSHMAVAGTKTKLQKEINAEIEEKWGKEMTKRNEYFSSFGITTLTFTDTDLTNPKTCFASIEEFLAKRPAKELNYDEQIEKLKNFK